MLPKVAIGRHCCAQSTNLENYQPLVGNGLIEEVKELAAALSGVRLCHINSTVAGGGVAELLGRHIPILQALGISADWRLIHGDPRFFQVTKGFHNALQGGAFPLSQDVRETYLEHNRESARLLEVDYDVYIVHDPQPAAIRHFARGRKAIWIWRCHIDSSEPEPEVWAFLREFVQEYDAVVFTMPEFCPPDLTVGRVAFIPPAIDPLSTKNMALPEEICRRALADSGLDLHRPILLQVSRFDPWKDPLGVIHVYRLVKEARPEVQLALVGSMAGDDPEGWALLEIVNEEAAKDPDLYVFTNLTGVGNMEVNAFQRGVDLVIQKSLKEGFGLVVSEAFWKGKPVVAGKAGGIPMQFPPEFRSYLVESVEECAEKVLKLVDHPGVRAEFGRAGRERVRQEFLLPRLIRDELALVRSLLADGAAAQRDTV
ncbi:MAG: glycosyltransferase [Candidatus Methylomirabilales bacterium]